jgi:chorismate synthase
MAGNTFGDRFRVTTWGESHGPFVGVVIDGCPSGLTLCENDIQKEVDRRAPLKNSKISTKRKEKDLVKILSGVFENKTTGTPISIVVSNEDIRTQDYDSIENIYRPGHADFSYDLKFGKRDYRGGGRASGRETVARVIAGAIAKKILEKHKTQIFGHTLQIGNIKASKFNKSEIEKNEVRCADKNASMKMIDLIKTIGINENDSIGALVEIIVKNPPKALGEPVFQKLDAEIAKAIISIGSVKGVEFGRGFDVVNMRGSENNDQMKIENKKAKFLSNNCGGILGGISTGEDLVLRFAVKPVPSIGKEQNTIGKDGKNKKIKISGRHDICLAPRIIPVAEAMVAITLVDFLFKQLR